MKSGKSVVAILVSMSSAMLLSACVSGNSMSDAARERLVQTDVDLAAIYLREGKLNFAKEKADKAIALDSDSSQANNINGLLYWRLGENDKADRYFRRAIHYQSDNSEALNNYGVFLCEQNRIDESIGYFKRAAANPLYPDRAQALTNAGRCLAKKGDDAKAEPYLRSALKMDPKFVSALFELAKLSYRTGRILTAQALMRKMFATGVSSAQTLYFAYQIETALGNQGAANHYANWLRRKYPTSTEAAQVATQ
jgi:type IV pilus assembly protein PilF